MIINKIGDFLNAISILAIFTSIIMLMFGFVGVIMYYIFPYLGDNSVPIFLLKNGGFLFISSLLLGVISNKMEDYTKTK